MAEWLVHLKRGRKSRRKPVFSFGGQEIVRTRIYIDGYNLYYGCLKRTSFKWLDLFSLFTQQIFPSIAHGGRPLEFTLDTVAIKFFTAQILEQAAQADDSRKCQEQYHSALRKHMPERVHIINGYYALTSARAKAIDRINPKKWPRECADVEVWKLEENKPMSILRSTH